MFDESTIVKDINIDKHLSGLYNYILNTCILLQKNNDMYTDIILSVLGSRRFYIIVTHIFYFLLLFVKSFIYVHVFRCAIMWLGK